MSLEDVLTQSLLVIRTATMAVRVNGVKEETKEQRRLELSGLSLSWLANLGPHSGQSCAIFVRTDLCRL